MRAAGWVLRLPISEEGDRITVVRRTVDGRLGAVAPPPRLVTGHLPGPPRDPVEAV